MAILNTNFCPSCFQPIGNCQCIKSVYIGTIHDYTGEVDGGGYKQSMDNPSKLPISLVPASFIRACARALQHGARKYTPNNWRRGMPMSECYSALQRHLLSWNDGEDTDTESSLQHLDHAAACLAFLIEYTTNPSYKKFDDRPKGKNET